MLSLKNATVWASSHSNHLSPSLSSLTGIISQLWPQGFSSLLSFFFPLSFMDMSPPPKHILNISFHIGTCWQQFLKLALWNYAMQNRTLITSKLKQYERYKCIRQVQTNRNYSGHHLPCLRALLGSQKILWYSTLSVLVKILLWFLSTAF